MKWQVFLATATGKHHLDSNALCQDTVRCVQVDDVLIAVVCDGAGSAKEGGAGAEFFANQVTEHIAAAIQSGELNQDGIAHCRDFLMRLIQLAREELETVAQERELELMDFACTLLGCIASKEGGVFFHIGDGFGIYQKHDGQSIVSPPENGEYSYETYFVTETIWQAHLRLTPLPSLNPGELIALMSDGPAPFAINREHTGFYRPFIDPVIQFLSDATEEAGNEALHHLLASEKTHSITTDDKTMMLAIPS